MALDIGDWDIVLALAQELVMGLISSKLGDVFLDLLGWSNLNRWREILEELFDVDSGWVRYNHSRVFVVELLDYMLGDSIFPFAPEVKNAPEYVSLNTNWLPADDDFIVLPRLLEQLSNSW